MSKVQTRLETDEDPFIDSDEWIGAEGRQMLRALTAYDPKAVEVCLYYLGDYLAKTLGRHLRRLPRWDMVEEEQADRYGESIDRCRFHFRVYGKSGNPATGSLWRFGFPASFTSTQLG